MFEERDTNGSPRRYYGKHAGVVVDNRAPPSGGHRGVLRVRVPAILEETADGPRPLEVDAHPCLPPGYFCLPKKDDHVWVEFAAGELEHPIWTGVWYPEGQPPFAVTDQLVVTDPRGYKAALHELINWLALHQHLGNMGAPTPLMVQDNGALELQMKPTTTGQP